MDALQIAKQLKLAGNVQVLSLRRVFVQPSAETVHLSHSMKHVMTETQETMMDVLQTARTLREDGHVVQLSLQQVLAALNAEMAIEYLK